MRCYFKIHSRASSLPDLGACSGYRQTAPSPNPTSSGLYFLWLHLPRCALVLLHRYVPCAGKGLGTASYCGSPGTAQPCWHVSQCGKENKVWMSPPQSGEEKIFPTKHAFNSSPSVAGVGVPSPPDSRPNREFSMYIKAEPCGFGGTDTEAMPCAPAYPPPCFGKQW